MNRQNGVTQPGKWIWLILTALVVGLGGVRSAQAHANLVRSEPAAGSALADAPTVVVLVFSEALDARATSVELRDEQSRLVVAGPGEIDPAQPQLLQLPLLSAAGGSPLPDGTYRAIWQARSAVDGHVTVGTVAFAVGGEALPASLLPPPGAPEPATALPAAVDSLARWLNYVAATVAAGSLLFGWLVWQPVYRRWGEATDASDKQATALLKRLAAWGCGVWAAATVLFVGVQAGAVNAGSLWSGVAIIAGGRSGILAGARLALLAWLALLIRRMPDAGSGRAGLWKLATAVSGAALLTFSLQSHSAALGGGRAAVAAAVDWLHLLAMSAWLGGLLPLALLLWSGQAPAGLATQIVPRFSRLALSSVGILLWTGVYNTWIHVQTVEALAATTHGRALSLKLGLFAVLLILGAINLLWLTPQLRPPLAAAEAAAVRRLGRTMRLEMALGVGVLLLAGVMLGVAPAFEALEAQQRLGFRESVRVEDVQLVLRIAPLHVGENEFAVDVQDRRAGAEESPPLALLRFRSENEAMGELQVEMTETEGGRFVARGAYLANAGNWQVEVILRRSGFDDARHTFDVVVETEHHQHGDNQGE